MQLIGTDQARGQEITVKGRPHTVIGVFKNTESPLNAIGIDIDERNADLALERVGPLLLTVEHLADRVTP